MPENKLFPQDPSYEYSDILPLAKRKGSPKGFGGVTLAVPNMLRDAAEGVNTLLRTPGEALRGELSSAEIMQRAPGMAMSLMGLSSPVPVPTGALRVFGGIGAKTADHDALSLAKKLWWNGSKDEEIFGKTGWFKDKDNNWKFEIPDTNAQWKGPAGPEGSWSYKSMVPASPGATPNVYHGPSFGAPTKLGDVLEHPDLFAAYPHLQDMKVGSTGFNMGIKGGFDPETNRMVLGLADNPKESMSVGLHEIQHGIQDYENFAEGGNTKQFLPDGFSEIYKGASDKLEGLRSEIRKLGANSVSVQSGLMKSLKGEEVNSYDMEQLKKVPDDLLMRFHEAVSDMAPMQQMRDQAYQDYLRLGGEVESRNVQERFESPENYLLHPHQTPGYPTSAQILNYGKGAPAESFTGWHGTPHTFDPVETNPLGEFRDSAIGSGEGAQVYGHGHYVAGAREVADQYARTLAKPNFALDGMKVQPAELPIEQHIGMNALHLNGGSVDKTIADLTARADRNMPQHLGTDPDDTRQVLLDAADWLKNNHGRISYDKSGATYHLEVKPDEHELLDWEKPLAEQHPQIQAAVAPLIQQLKNSQYLPKGYDEKARRSGNALYNGLSNLLAGAPQASKALSEAGIPGIKYLDQFSRNLKDPATYSEELTPAQQRGLEIINSAGQGSAWESGEAVDYHKRLLENFTQTLEHSPENAMVGGKAGLTNNIEALKSIDPAKLVSPKRTRNYVIFDPKNIKIIGRHK